MKLVRLAAALVLLGLVVEFVTLSWSHPLAFLAFALIGGLTLGVGVLLFLYWLFFREKVIA
jgi:hypothetical protein